MGLSAKRRIILAKVESVYGTDPTPIGTDAMQVSNLDVSPMEAEIVQRDYIQGSFGAAERVMAQKNSKISFEVEVGGHANLVKGATPAIDCLIRACGFAASQSTRVIASITRVSTTATVTTTGSHGLSTGDKVAQTGSVESEYNGTFTVTVTGATTYTITVTGTPTTPGTGSPLLKTAYVYTPISSAIPSVTFYAHFDGILHKITGAMGNMSLDLSVKAIPKFKFEFIGLYNAPIDGANPVADVTNFTIPLAANTTNTTAFSLLSYSGYLESLSINLNNLVNYKNLIGLEAVEINDRAPSGSLSIEAVLVAAKDFWSAAVAQTTGACTVTHGTANGNKLVINMPKVMIDSPKYKELNQNMMLTCNVTALRTSGNDELTLSFQ